MNEPTAPVSKPRRGGPRPSGKPGRVMVSVPAPLVGAVKEIVKVYRQQQREIRP